MSDFVKVMDGRTLEYYDDEHLYLVDGVIVPSITQILSAKFGNKYQNVNKKVLQDAADAGTAVHEAIENYCKDGTESDLVELRNFKFLQKHYDFNVMGNEIPVILCDGYTPIAAGRVDMVIDMGGMICGADIKRTSVLDKQYIAYQLNLYRIAYRQSYGIEWEGLYALHLRNDTRKLVNIPINEDIAWELVNDFMKGEKT